MTVQDNIVEPASGSPEFEQIPQLYAVLDIVGQIASKQCGSADIPDDPVLVQAYSQSPGIVRKAFDAVATETAMTAASGAEKLIGKGERAPSAAQRLARYLRERIGQLGRIVGL